jgi:hypothetical protein
MLLLIGSIGIGVYSLCPKPIRLFASLAVMTVAVASHERTASLSGGELVIPKYVEDIPSPTGAQRLGQGRQEAVR